MLRGSKIVVVLLDPLVDTASKASAALLAFDNNGQLVAGLKLVCLT
jgi:hypothetical protein